MLMLTEKATQVVQFTMLLALSAQSGEQYSNCRLVRVAGSLVLHPVFVFCGLEGNIPMRAQ